jgi:hypothetical protein
LPSGGVNLTSLESEPDRAVIAQESSYWTEPTKIHTDHVSFRDQATIQKFPALVNKCGLAAGHVYGNLELGCAPMSTPNNAAIFDEALEGLRRGDFTRLIIFFRVKAVPSRRSSNGLSRGVLPGTIKNLLKRSPALVSMAAPRLPSTY